MAEAVMGGSWGASHMPGALLRPVPPTHSGRRSLLLDGSGSAWRGRARSPSSCAAEGLSPPTAPPAAAPRPFWLPGLASPLPLLVSFAR